ncbi:hypothetical protein [Roseicyclus elongatus]|uniref:hypothetical protein n=1 Tax=Roseicyclus elongatus TaxID=159346 RepID=UPI00046CBA6A|nr:hypothetical protein [Roseibacterium elongatum]
MSEPAADWLLTEEDLGLLQLVRDEIWSWRSVCRGPEHLLALGAIVSGVDALLAGKTPDAAATVSFNHVASGENRSTAISLNEDTLALSHSAQFYSPAAGGDSESHVDALFDQNGRCSEVGVADWLNLCAELRPLANELEVEIHTFPEV